MYTKQAKPCKFPCFPMYRIHPSPHTHTNKTRFQFHSSRWCFAVREKSAPLCHWFAQKWISSLILIELPETEWIIDENLYNVERCTQKTSHTKPKTLKFACSSQLIFYSPATEETHVDVLSQFLFHCLWLLFRKRKTHKHAQFGNVKVFVWTNFDEWKLFF